MKWRRQHGRKGGEEVKLTGRQGSCTGRLLQQRLASSDRKWKMTEKQGASTNQIRLTMRIHASVMYIHTGWAKCLSDTFLCQRALAISSADSKSEAWCEVPVRAACRADHVTISFPAAMAPSCFGLCLEGKVPVRSGEALTFSGVTASQAHLIQRIARKLVV